MSTVWGVDCAAVGEGVVGSIWDWVMGTGVNRG